jgi:NTE family protein
VKVTPMSSSDSSAQWVPRAEQSRVPAFELKTPSRPPSVTTDDGRRLAPLRKSHRDLPRPPFECVALVLQGGGALGAYQGGVYQALLEANLQPNWVSGISIGAINAALIAGNAPEQQLEKLHAFWNQVSMPRLSLGLEDHWLRGDLARSFVNRLNANAVAFNGVGGFFAPRRPPPYLFPPGMLEATSWYDTAPLGATLEQLVDFDRLNNSAIRFSVGAVNIRTGNFTVFDSTTHTIRPEHIMASGALPPGFPPIEVDGELYWDGGLVSNTPLQWVVAGDTRLDTLAFQIDLWSARGDIPADLHDVMMRQKEIQYSSRTRAYTDQFKAIQHARTALANIIDKLPPDVLDSDDGKILRIAADKRVYKIVHLIYRSKRYEVQSKDYEFSRTSMTEHWTAGYQEAVRTLRHPEALERPTDRLGVATFDLGVDGRE